MQKWRRKMINIISTVKSANDTAHAWLRGRVRTPFVSCCVFKCVNKNGSSSVGRKRWKQNEYLRWSSAPSLEQNTEKEKVKEREREKKERERKWNSVPQRVSDIYAWGVRSNQVQRQHMALMISKNRKRKKERKKKENK